jgi:CRISPR-associated protein Cmr1
MKTYNVKLRALTPIWTGDVDKNSSTLRETGILGSLRWWYEAIVRGYGAYACDPADKSCEFDYDAYNKTTKKEEKIEAGLKSVCPVCRLFGCTGWKRRFTLKVESQEDPVALRFTSGLNSNKRRLNKIFGNEDGTKKTIYGNFELSFTADQKDDLDRVLGLLYFVSKYAFLGAKPQYGFGIFDFVDDMAKKDAEEAWRKLKSGLNKCGGNKPQDDRCPNITDFFCLNVSNIYHKGQNQYPFIPIAFDIRYKDNSERGLRVTVEQKHGKEIAKDIFGSPIGRNGTGGMRSHVFVSHLYKDRKDYALRVVGFIPQMKKEKIATEKIIIKQLEKMFDISTSDISQIYGRELL